MALAHRILKWGSISAGILLALCIAYAFLVPVGGVHDSPRFRIQGHLSHIGYAVLSYKDAHDDNLPPDLESLVPEFVAADQANIFFDPRDSSIRDLRTRDLSTIKREIHERSIFKLIPHPTDEIIAYEHPTQFNKDTESRAGARCILYSDFHTGEVTRDQCEKLELNYSHGDSRHQ